MGRKQGWFCCIPCLFRKMSLEAKSMPGVACGNAGVVTKPPSLPLFASMQPPPALNHPAQKHMCFKTAET